jgi:hypothetical protein
LRPSYTGKRARAKSRLDKGEKEISMFLTVFVILLVMWLLGLFAFHVAGGLIHLLLIIAVISLVVHFVSGRRAA